MISSAGWAARRTWSLFGNTRPWLWSMDAPWPVCWSPR